MEDPAPATPDDDPNLSTELPVVTLGQDEAEEAAPKVRVLPGRVHLSAVLYPMYLLIIISGGLAANIALDTDEWSFPVVVLTWTAIYMWVWMYGIAWSYRRRLFEATCIAMTLGMEAGVALLCWDRAAPQLVAASNLPLAERPGLPMLEWAGHLLLLCAAGLLAHVVFLGRGYRKKREVHEADMTPSTTHEAP